MRRPHSAGRQLCRVKIVDVVSHCRRLSAPAVLAARGDDCPGWCSSRRVRVATTEDGMRLPVAARFFAGSGPTEILVLFRLAQGGGNVAAIHSGDTCGRLERQSLVQEGLRYVFGGDLDSQQIASHIALIVDATGS